MSSPSSEPGDDTVAIALWQTTDAMEWARAFNALYPEPDIDTMLGWFANAIEKGRSAGEANAVEPGRCPERCGGIIGHAGHHQTSDYAEIKAEARRSALNERQKEADRSREG